MSKKNNYRAHKRALKKASYKNNRNTYQKEKKKEERILTESFGYQVNKFLESVAEHAKKSIAGINVNIAKIKYSLTRPFGKKKSDVEFNDLVDSFAMTEHISVALAAIILCNCLASSNIRSMSPRTVNLDAINHAEEVQDDLIDDEFEEILDGTTQSDTEAICTDFTGVLDEIDALSFARTIEKRELDDEEKLSMVLDKYSITERQFKVMVAKVLLESGEYYQGLKEPGSINRYDECYSIASTYFNRYSSASCINFVNKRMGPDMGLCIYNHAICPGQYTVSSSLVDYLVQTDLSLYSGWTATLDMLLSGKPSHNLYRFVSPRLKDNPKYRGAIQLNANGNYYFAEVKDRVDPGDFLPNYNSYYGIVSENGTLYKETSKLLLLKPIDEQRIR